MLVQILRPFSYLAIRHTSKLPFYVNWLVPAIVSFVLVAFFSWGLRADFFSGNGLLSKLLGFLQSLPGFFIAALAAISTFNNPDMLKPMPGETPTMKVLYGGGLEVVRLTRRRFLSSMFAYLTALSIFLTLGAIFGLAIAQPLKDMLPSAIHEVVRLLAGSVFFLFVGQLVCITLWGLFYLGERIHTPDN